MKLPVAGHATLRLECAILKKRDSGTGVFLTILQKQFRKAFSIEHLQATGFVKLTVASLVFVQEY